MRFVPVKLNASNFAVGKFDISNAFEFSPTTVSVDLLQLVYVTDARADGYAFNILNRADDFEIYVHESIFLTWGVAHSQSEQYGQRFHLAFRAARRSNSRARSWAAVCRRAFWIAMAI